jgi:hypothetical protein
VKLIETVSFGFVMAVFLTSLGVAQSVPRVGRLPDLVISKVVAKQLPIMKDMEGRKFDFRITIQNVGQEEFYDRIWLSNTRLDSTEFERGGFLDEKRVRIPAGESMNFAVKQVFDVAVQRTIFRIDVAEPRGKESPRRNTVEANSNNNTYVVVLK